jgi:zinc transporter 2
MGVTSWFTFLFVPVLCAPSEVHVELGAAGQVIAVWQAPSEPPRGILFLAHGCHHAATSWWSASAACPSCTGLPEELRIVTAVLQKGLVALAVTSANRITGCWDGSDADRVRTVVANVTAKLQSTNQMGPGQATTPPPPLYAFGASSGARFTLMMPSLGFELAGIAAQIMSIPVRVLQNRAPYPPTIFVHMPKDKHMAGRILKCIKTLQGARVRTAEIQLHSLPIEETFFARRIGGSACSLEQSRALSAALESHGFLDESTRCLKKDPRRLQWRQVLSPLVDPEVDSLIDNESPISAVLNVAYGHHEMSCDSIEPTLDFLLA